MNYVFQFGDVLAARWDLLWGSWLAIQLSAAMVLGLLVAVLCALGKTMGPKPVRWLVDSYIEAIRNAPFLVQIFLIFFGLPRAGISLNRIPYLLTGKVDVLVATFGITPERARQVQFCIPYSSIDIVLMVPAERKIAAAADLATLKVGVARTSTQDTAISGVVPQGTRVMRFDDDATTAQALLSNQIDAIGVNTITAQQIQTMNPQAKRSSCCGISRTASPCAAARPICISGSTRSSTSSTRSTASG